MDVYKMIVFQIKEKREELGLSYGDLSIKTGINKSTLQRYEKGEINSMTLRNYLKLKEALYIRDSECFIINSIKANDNIEVIINEVIDILENKSLLLQGKEVDKSAIEPLIESLRIGLLAAQYKNIL